MGSLQDPEISSTPRSDHWELSIPERDTLMVDTFREYEDTISYHQSLSYSNHFAQSSFCSHALPTQTDFASSPLSSEFGLQNSYSRVQPHTRHANEALEAGSTNEAVSSLVKLPSVRLRQQLKHSGGPSHRSPWRCLWPDCEKVYTRRDTLARHHAKHKNGGHVCELCRQVDKFTVFKRKDHLNGHIRNCHKENTKNSGQLIGDATALSEMEPRYLSIHGNENNTYQFAEVTTVLYRPELQNEIQYPNFDDYFIDDGTEDKGDKASLHATSDCVEPRKQAMSELVTILSRVLGDQWQEIMGMLGDRVPSLSGSSMQQLAECMADAALTKTGSTLR